mmetsp:Transcript_68946/g.109467  ORF Transcript_68946/g.109467 Transcript_68946/m.109467 type:complete len:218 (+) Transcript_68946:84-737(+)
MNEDALNDIELDTDANVEDNVEVSKDFAKLGSEEGEKKEEEETWWNTAYKVGENVLYVADFLGEVFAEFFGMTQSRYQWAIDAYERQQRWEREEKKREQYHKQMLMEQVAQNRKNKKKNAKQDEIARNLNQNDITLSIDKTASHEQELDDGEVMQMHEEETGIQSAETNNDGMHDDGKEEEEPEIQDAIQRHSHNNEQDVERNLDADAIEINAAANT